MRTRMNARAFWAAAVPALVLTGLLAGGARADFYDEQYEMDAPPDQAAGTVNGFTLAVAGGNGTNGPSGSTFSNGVMTFLDDANSSGPQGYFLPPESTLLSGSPNFIADFRIQILQPNQGTGGSKLMSFKSTNGRGLHMDPGFVTWVNGTNPVGTTSNFDFSQFTEVRVVINGGTNMADLYVSTTGSVNTPTSNYTNLASTTMGGSGAAGELGTIGFALGSLAGSSTTLANFNLDWFRVESGSTDVNEVFEVVPEPATSGVLIFGCLPILMRRGRRRGR